MAIFFEILLIVFLIGFVLLKILRFAIKPIKAIGLHLTHNKVRQLITPRILQFTKAALLVVRDTSFVVISIAILGVTIFVIWSFLQSMIIHRTYGDNFGSIDLPINETGNFVVILEISDRNSQDSSIEVKLTAIIAPATKDINDKEVCLKAVYLDDRLSSNIIYDLVADDQYSNLWSFNIAGSRTRSDGEVAAFYLKDICTKEKAQVYWQSDLTNNIIDQKSTVLITLNKSPSSEYPLDSRFLSLTVWAESTMNKVQYIDIAGLVFSDEWDQIIQIYSLRTLSKDFIDPIWEEAKFNKELGEDLKVFDFHINKTSISISYFRPLARILTILIILVFSSIFIILLIFINDVGNFSQTALAILLGLWGIQSILIPNDIKSQTRLEGSIIALYALLAIAIMIRVFKRQLLASQETSDNDIIMERMKIYQEFFSKVANLTVIPERCTIRRQKKNRKSSRSVTEVDCDGFATTEQAKHQSKDSVNCVFDKLQANSNSQELLKKLLTNKDFED